jgi:hypothetical protein
VKLQAQFDPPLSIPGKGKANIGGFDAFEDIQPMYLTVEVSDGSGARIALGLFAHVAHRPGVYRLINGTACTSDDKDHAAVKIVRPGAP